MKRYVHLAVRTCNSIHARSFRQVSSVTLLTVCATMAERCVKSPMDMGKWTRSQAFAQLIDFITSCSSAVQGVKSTDAVHESPNVAAFGKILQELDSYVDMCPPEEMPQRYGNKAYRTWYAKLQEVGAFSSGRPRHGVGPLQSASTLLRAFLTSTSVEPTEPLIAKLADYLLDSFGNQTRIDYGTGWLSGFSIGVLIDQGHEAAFVVLLSCLQRLGVFTPEDRPAIVVRLFVRYLALCRRLQLTYSMEPAGSQGVWALDDYQFVPFIWGSAQLCDHPNLTPNSMLNEALVEKHADEYMFFGCIQFILGVKTGPFAEHSNQLWNISGVPRWQKVNMGLVKMYKAEVLSKFPVIQHFKFCDLFPIDAQNP